MLEREVKLGAGPGFHLPVLEGLGDGLSAQPGESLRLETVYYDTPDLRLVRWGCSLRHRRGEGWTLKLPSGTHGDALERQELTFPGTFGRPPAAVVALVQGYVRRSSLGPVARLSTLRHRVRILDGGGRRAAEVVDDEVTVMDGRRVAGRFRELEVELSPQASPELLGQLSNRLRAAGAGLPDPTPKLVRAVGPPALQPAEAAPLPLSGSPTTAEAIRHAIATSVAHLLIHDPLLRVGGDPEDVHQARVATRRLRSSLRLFRRLLEPEWARQIRDELGWLAAELGAVRDSEVLRDRLRGRAPELSPADGRALERLAGRLDVEVERGRQNLLAGMSSPRYLDLVESLVRAATLPAVLPEAEAPAAEMLPALVARAWRPLRQGVGALGDPPPDEELHQIRILAKRARYAAEAAAPVLGQPAAAFAKAAARVQTVLGEHQDSVTAQVWLRAAPGSSRQAFVAGQLYALETSAQRAAREAWPGAWNALDRKRIRAWLRGAPQTS